MPSRSLGSCGGGACRPTRTMTSAKMRREMVVEIRFAIPSCLRMAVAVGCPAGLPGESPALGTVVCSASIPRFTQQTLCQLKPEDLDRSVTFFNGQPMRIRDILWGAVISHGTHHRGQLSLMCRLAGGCSPGLYGPNREEMAAMRANAS